MKNQVSESHRRELLKFLLLKTAAVRSGIKPAELLHLKERFQHYPVPHKAGVFIGYPAKDVAGIENLKVI